MYKISYNLLLHVVQNVFEVQIIVVVFNSLSYTALKQGRCLDTMERGRNKEQMWSLLFNSEKNDDSLNSVAVLTLTTYSGNI